MHSTVFRRATFLAAIVTGSALSALSSPASAALPKAAVVAGYDDLAPFSQRMDIVCSANRGVGTLTVPAGQRLVVDYISADVAVDIGGTALFDVVSYLNGAEVESHLPMHLNGTLLGQSVFSVSEKTRIYADSLSTFEIAILSSTPSCGSIVGVYGHYIPTP
jgi:hypothetical protein